MSNNVTLSSRSYKIGDRLYLNGHSINTKAEAVEVHNPTNHVYCCDISGSMYDSLGKMRTQLKNRLSSVIAEEDTITIIGFASSNECFVLKEKVHCNTPAELKMLHTAIDKFLVPMGCTDFVQPINATNKLIGDDTSSFWNFIFLSDGGHNCGPFEEVMNALEYIKDKICNALIIEYGYWADSHNLSLMAESLGGTKIVAADFDSYVPAFEGFLKNANVSPKIEIKVDFDILSNLKEQKFFYMNTADSSIHVLTVSKDNKIYVPENITEIFSLSSKKLGGDYKSEECVNALYAAIYVCSDALKYGIVENILSNICDSKFMDQYSTAYGKQKLFKFQNDIREATFNVDARGQINKNYKPNVGAYCIVDLVNDLKAGNNQILICDLNYNRTTAKTEDKIELTPEETEALKKANTAAKVDKIMNEAKKRKVQMKYVNKGYPISKFTWNETRANLSAMFTIDVELTLPENKFKIEKVNSFVYRNYTFIRDGIVNFKDLPVIIDDATLAKLKKANVPMSEIEKVSEGNKLVIDLSNIPVLNRNKVYASKKKKMTKLVLELMDYKFELKYLGYLKKQLNIVEESFVEDLNFSDEAKEYLASIGITSKGYSPLKETIKGTEFYNSLNLVSDFKSFSSIPKIEAIDKKIKDGKNLTPSEKYMQSVMAFIDKKFLSNAKNDAYKEAVKSAFSALTIKKRAVEEELAQMKFAMIVSRKWFLDCENYDDNIDTIKSSFDQELTIEYRFVEKQENI